MYIYIYIYTHTYTYIHKGSIGGGCCTRRAGIQAPKPCGPPRGLLAAPVIIVIVVIIVIIVVIVIIAVIVAIAVVVVIAVIVVIGADERGTGAVCAVFSVLLASLLFSCVPFCIICLCCCLLTVF